MTGVMGVVYESYSDDFLERVVEFEEFAQQVTIVVENAKLIENVRTELSRNQVLYTSDRTSQSTSFRTEAECGGEKRKRKKQSSRFAFYRSGWFQGRQRQLWPRG